MESLVHDAGGVTTFTVNSPPRFEGRPIRLGGVEYVLPSLSTRQARELWADLRELSSQGKPDESKERIEKAVRIIHCALTRNYPDLTFDSVDELIDFTGLFDLLALVCERSRVNSPGPQPDGGALQAANG